MNRIAFSLFAIVFLLSSLLWTLPEVHAQQSTRQILKELESEGKTNCEVWQINDYLYKTVRITLVHDRITEHIVKVTSDDPESNVSWDGTKDSFRLVTDSSGRHRVEVILDYEFKHDEPRQVFFQVFAESNVLMMEGNWVHEGFTFCKIIDFWTVEAPHILTADEITEINNKFNADFRRESAEQNTTVENGLLVLSIVVVVLALLNTIYFLGLILTQRSLGKVADRPAKKFAQMTDKVRKLVDVLQLLMQHMLATDKEVKKEIVDKIDSKIRDIQIVAIGAKQKVEIRESFPEPNTLVTPNNLSTSPPVKAETISAEQEKRNEEVYEEEYGVKKPDLKEEITFATLSDKEYDKRKESISHETDKQVESDQKYVEIKEEDVRPCVVCGKDPEYFCKACERMFCKDHEDHTCKKKDGRAVSKINLIKDKIVDSFIERNDSITTSDEFLMKELDGGIKKDDIIKELIKEYMKIPFKEAKDKFVDMKKDYEKNKTFPKQIRNDAMLERLVRSDR